MQDILSSYLKSQNLLESAMFAYHLVDVFTDVQFGGNQLAVFLDAQGMSTVLMQTITRELNLSECAFVFPAQDDTHDYHVRIFTPGRELPMAGHPTIGTAFTLAHTGHIPVNHTVRFLEGVGVIAVDVQQTASGIRADMAQPSAQFGHIFDDRARMAALLSITEADLLPDYAIQVVSTGVPFVYVPVRDLNVMRKVKFRLDLWEQELKDTDYPQVFVFTPQAQTLVGTVHARMFAPSMGITEDPATGAACGPLGAYLARYGLTDDPQNIVCEQGFEMNRPSLIHIQVQDTAIIVGGYTQPVGTGQITVLENKTAG